MHTTQIYSTVESNKPLLIQHDESPKSCSSVWLLNGTYYMVHTVWLQLYEVQEQAKPICGDKSQPNSYLWWVHRLI